VSNHDIEGRVPPEATTDAANPQSGAPDSLERQLAREREARQLIRDRLRHTEALAAESHALRSKMAEELERVTADRDRLRAQAQIAAAVAVPDPAPTAPTPPGREPVAAASARPPAAPPAADLRERPASIDGASAVPVAAGGPRAAATPRTARGVEPTMSTPPPTTRPREDHPIGERPLKPPVRRGPWRALAMLGGLAVAVAGLAWLTGTMPTGLDVASLKAAVADHSLGPTRAASTPGLALDTRGESPAASVALASATPSVATNSTANATPPAPHGAVPLPPLTPDAQIAAAPTAAGAQPAAASTTASMPSPAPLQAPARAQSQLQAEGGLDVRLRKALDGEGITAIVQVDPASGHVLVADPQADRTLRDRTDMLIRAVYAGASLPEPQIEHRWMSPMHGERSEPLQAQAQPQPPAPQGKGTSHPVPRPRTQGQAQAPAPAQTPGTSQHELTNAREPGLAAVERINLSPPGAGSPTRHVESLRPTLSVADAEDLRPVVPAGRITVGCMQDISGRTTNRRAALSACMKHSCCSGSGNLNSDECRAYQKAYPFTCGAG